MKDIPIIFSGPMVRALLEGRKTMTRRLLYSERKAKNGVIPGRATFLQGYPQPCIDTTRHQLGTYWTLSGWHKAKPGDRLWVRETWQLHSRATDLSTVVYRASINQSWTEAHEMFPASLVGNLQPRPFQEGWRSPLHIPRWASRLTLVVTATKIERLHDIASDDIVAEGAKGPFSQETAAIPGPAALDAWEEKAQYAWEALWTSLHGEQAWHDNPWVVTLSFTVHKTNINAMAA